MQIMFLGINTYSEVFTYFFCIFLLLVILNFLYKIFKNSLQKYRKITFMNVIYEEMRVKKGIDVKIYPFVIMVRKFLTAAILAGFFDDPFFCQINIMFFYIF